MIRLVAILITLLITTPAWSGFDEGVAAYKGGRLRDGVA